MSRDPNYALAKKLFFEAQALFGSRDYTTSIDRAIQAQLCMAAIPDTSRTGDVLTFWRQLDGLMSSARERERTAAIRASGGPQSTRVVYANPRSPGSE
jgi:hypothetical protein